MAHPTRLLPSIEALCRTLTGQYLQISDDRRSSLTALATYLADRCKQKQACRIIAICTHNSRRSHFTQLWLAIAADYYSVEGLHTYSGGTEATALHPNAVAVLRRAGLDVAETTQTENPHYPIRWRKEMPPYLAFSKVYDADPNPQSDFAAVMVCSAAAADCPVVPKADRRFAIPYDDPKAADGTPAEEAVYDERFREIGRDMLYVMRLVAAEKAG
ncbi:protein-tyrosine-phosphatase [Lewinella sp. IMCC34191]|uniref:protein-tyrosine-phosphatase n=1 Tax=Lewinella sp. IMCC34191 TaxID=2259172 RepID=UPI0018E575AD|nr:protein-tyrosine-phosphatase [Lewinella sp. IMCC34191]